MSPGEFRKSLLPEGVVVDTWSRGSSLEGGSTPTGKSLEVKGVVGTRHIEGEERCPTKYRTTFVEGNREALHSELS